LDDVTVQEYVVAEQAVNEYEAVLFASLKLNEV
jgi:hypothetical protein